MIDSEFNTMFDRDYAARQVLGRHGRGASDADVKLFADALANNLMQRYGSSLIDFNTELRVRIKSETALPRGLGPSDKYNIVVRWGEREREERARALATALHSRSSPRIQLSL